MTVYGKSDQGILYLVGTPIGNLEDITLRALRVLREADLIAAEDTRAAKKLLGRYRIKKPLLSYFDPKEKERSPRIVERLKGGARVALVSEAGTPGVSDPGYRLVEAALREGIRIVPVPGPSAALAALTVSGLPADRFVFEGFLPPRLIALRKKCLALGDEERTMVFFESPRRLRRTLEEMAAILGSRRIAVARELTKRFEEIIRGTILEVTEAVRMRRIRGEIVIVVEGRRGEAALPAEPLPDQVRRMEKEMGLTRMEAIKLIARLHGVRKSQVYRQVHLKQ